MTWTDYFKAAADQNRWTLSRLADETAIPRHTLQNWMRPAGDKGSPSISEAILLAEVMGMGLDELFRGVVPDDQIDAIVQRAASQVRAVVLDGLEG